MFFVSVRAHGACASGLIPVSVSLISYLYQLVEGFIVPTFVSFVSFVDFDLLVLYVLPSCKLSDSFLGGELVSGLFAAVDVAALVKNEEDDVDDSEWDRNDT